MKRPATIIRQVGLFDAPQFPAGSSPAPVPAPVDRRVVTTTTCSTCRWGEEQGRYCGALNAAPGIAGPAGYWIMAGSSGACPSWAALSRRAAASRGKGRTE
jgi:hypothetical protein